ncbi:hypothetical protein [Thiosocius teredinicola]|uniref:hypothetical protein n=1 Tax=Thiosocius teredinicola TaxID=1973002 RepID=UPI000F79FE24
MFNLRLPSSNSVCCELSVREIFAYFFVPVLLYAGFATDFTFDFFAPYKHWHAYNHYFLSLADGRLDVPAAAIGREGSYLHGKAYMYYGVLPAFVRVFFYPFVDLTQVPVSAFSVWFFCVIGNVALQAAVLSYARQNRKHQADRNHVVALVLVSLLIWFGSATFIILQRPTMYHEPYAAALCLLNIFFALLIKDRFFLKGNHSTLAYGVLAGLCVHARMPTALALYGATVFLIIISAACTVGASGFTAGIRNFPGLVVAAVRHHWATFAAMFLLGVSILIMNYARYEDALAFLGVNYGFGLAGEGYSPRRCGIYETSEFYRLVRMIPNTIVYTIGGWDLHEYLTRTLHTGYGRKALPIIPTLFLWLAPTLAILASFYVLVTKRVTQRAQLLLFWLIVSVGGYFQLSYPTINHRYIAELWPIYLFAIVLVFSTRVDGRVKWPASFNLVAAVLVAFTLAYNLKVAFFSEYHFRTEIPEAAYFSDDPEKIAFLEQLDDEQIKRIQKEFEQGKIEGCTKLKAELNLD